MHKRPSSFSPFEDRLFASHKGGLEVFTGGSEAEKKCGETHEKHGNQQSAKTNTEWRKKKNPIDRKLESIVEHQRFRYVKVVSNHKRLPASNPAVCSQTWRDVSERQRNTSVLCYVYSPFVGRQNLFLRASDRGAPGEGVKIPWLSKINPLSHALTFTAAPERGSVRGGCPASVSFVTVRRTRFPLCRGEKLHWWELQLLRPSTAEGQEGGKKKKTLAFFSFTDACLRVGRVCVEMHDVWCTLNWAGGTLFL